MAFSRFIHVQIYNASGSAIQYDNQTDTNWGIVSGTMKLNKTLMDTEFAYGECNSSCFEIQVFGLPTNVDLGRRKIKVESISVVSEPEYWVDENGDNIVNEDGDYIVFYDGDSTETTTIFAGWIDTSEKDAISTDRRIVAYDWFYFHRHDNIAEWWNQKWAHQGTDEAPTYSIGNFRSALMTYMGISYPPNETYTSSLDSVIISNTFEAETDSLEFEAVFRSLAEITCQTYVMTDFTYIKPITLGSTSVNISDNVESVNSTWQDYTTSNITGISVYDTSSTLAQNYVPTGGTTDNMLKIVGNIFLVGMNTETLTTALASMYNLVKDIVYIPSDIKCIVSDIHHQLGQTLVTPKGNTYIMKLSYSGSLLVEESIEAVASGKKLSEDVKNWNNSLMEYGRYARVTQDIESFKIEYGNFKDDVQASFEVTDSTVVMKVDSNGNIGLCELSANPDDGLTYFSINADHISFVANHSLNLSSANLSVTSSHFSVDTSGNITATNVDLTGEINATSGTIAGFTINSSGVYLESDYVQIHPYTGITLNPTLPSADSYTTRIDTDIITLGDWIVLDPIYKGGVLPVGEKRWEGNILVNGADSNSTYQLSILSDDIIKTDTAEYVSGVYDGWGGTSFNSLNSLLDKLANDYRVPLGTETTRTEQQCFGYITNSSTKLYVFVPMKLAMDIPDETNVRVTAISGSLRVATGGYVGGLGYNANLLSYFTEGKVSQIQEGLMLTFTGGNWGTNNITVTGSVTLTFEICNYKWYYNSDKTLVVREKVSDKSFRWYFNNFDTTNAGRGGNSEYYVPSALRKFVNFDYTNETPPVQVDGVWYYYNEMQGTNKASGGGNYIGFEIRDGYTTPYIIAYHTERIYRGPNNRAIIEDSDFDLGATYYGGAGAMNSIVRRSNHSWSAPTFDPMNG